MGTDGHGWGAMLLAIGLAVAGVTIMAVIAWPQLTALPPADVAVDRHHPAYTAWMEARYKQALLALERHTQWDARAWGEQIDNFLGIDQAHRDVGMFEWRPWQAPVMSDPPTTQPTRIGKVTADER